jgi:hypothetical protein
MSLQRYQIEASLDSFHPSRSLAQSRRLVEFLDNLLVPRDRFGPSLPGSISEKQQWNRLASDRT